MYVYTKITETPTHTYTNMQINFYILYTCTHSAQGKAYIIIACAHVSGSETFIYIQTYIHTYMHTYIHIHQESDAYLQERAHTNLDRNHSYTYTHTYVHAYMHAHQENEEYLQERADANMAGKNSRRRKKEHGHDAEAMNDETPNVIPIKKTPGMCLCVFVCVCVCVCVHSCVYM